MIKQTVQSFPKNDREFAAIPSKDAFGQNDFVGTDMSDRKRRKTKRQERHLSN